MSTGSQVQAKIIRMIRSGQVSPGDRLPSERILAEQFSVSRNTVREAIRALAEKEILVSRRGAGSYVQGSAWERIAREFRDTLISKKLRLAEIFEVRTMLEPAVAAKVAVTATPEELSCLADILENQARAIEDGGDPTPWDLAFHATLVRISKNSVLMGIYATLDRILEESRTPDLPIPERARLSLACHRQILSALEQGDAGSAAQAMTRHMTETLCLLNQKIEKDIK